MKASGGNFGSMPAAICFIQNEEPKCQGSVPDTLTHNRYRSDWKGDDAYFLRTRYCR